MIDIENQIYTPIAKALRGKFSGLTVSGEYVNAPSGFPYVSIVEQDNFTTQAHLDSGNTEAFATLMYEVNVYSSFRNATEKIVGAKGGYYEITYDEDGFPTGWSLRDTPTVTENTKMWIMSTGGLGFSDDGGKTVSQIALTSDGYVNATALAVGSSNADGTSEITYMDKWFRFSKDGMEIGSSDDGENIKLRLNNNRISFLSDDMEVAYISSNKLYITDGEFLNRLVLGNFGFIPRQNGNLSFKKVK